jgi:D-xylose transport system substrate-binding protein
MRIADRLWMVPSFILLGVALCSAQTEKKELKIGFSIENVKGERWQTDMDEFQSRAQELGAAVVTRSADGDDDLQYKQVQEMLDSGIDALVYLPHDTEKATRIVNAAHAKHVPVISYDRLADAPVDLYVGFDLFSVGTEQAQSLVEKAPKGNYLLLGGSKLDANSKAVRAGQMKVLQPLIDRGDIKIVGDFWVPEWSATEAYVLITTALANMTVPPTAIVASNDSLACGAIQALEDKKLAGEVVVSGQDADLAAMERIFNGTQWMTVYKPVGREAQTAAEAAVKLAKHQDVENVSLVPNGANKTKALLLSPIAVNEQNAKETVFKDGYQKMEVVRQGLPPEKQALLEK